MGAMRSSKYGGAHVSATPNKEWIAAKQKAQHRLGLDDALQPIKEQGGRNVPYFVGTDENQWKSLMDNMHEGIRTGTLNSSDIGKMLKISDAEAQRFFNYSRRNSHTRHEEYGVPHAYSSENLYKELLGASGKHTVFNNEIDDQATDLRMTLNGKDMYVDVQNRTPKALDVHTLGFIKGLQGRDRGLGVAEYRNASNNTKLRDILGRIDRNASRTPFLDKLGESRNRVTNEAYTKDYLIGGKYREGDVSNILNSPDKGGYDFVKPRQVDLIDLERLRTELVGMTKGDLTAAKVRPLNFAEDKLKFGIPAQLVEALGALRNEQIDPELVRLIQK